MPNQSDQVIDLTESFSLADHAALSNIIIELDDSLNERNNSRLLQVSATLHDNNTHRLATTTRRYTHRLATTTRRCENSNHTQKKAPVTSRKGRTPPAKKADKEVQEDSYRERSPIKIGDCPICFDSLSKNPLASTKCGHVFCLSCLERSLSLRRQDKRCPTCRRPLKGANAYHPLFLPRG